MKVGLEHEDFNYSTGLTANIQGVWSLDARAEPCMQTLVSNDTTKFALIFFRIRENFVADNDTGKFGRTTRVEFFRGYVPC